jgi:hypothetical protein
MKASFWDRVLMFLYVLLAAVLLLGVALRPLGIDIIGDLVRGLDASVGRLGCLLICYGIVGIMALLSVYMLSMIFRGDARADRSFITVDSGDGGRVRIALSALEQMARQAIEGVGGVEDMQIHVGSDDDAISVAVDLTLLKGAHVPTVTMNMQKTIRNNIEANCGIAVRAVEITVRSLVGDEGHARHERRRLKFPRRRRGADEAAPAIPLEPLTDPEPVLEPEPTPEPEPEPWPDDPVDPSDLEPDEPAAPDDLFDLPEDPPDDEAEPERPYDEA